jgi:ribosomal protein S18 acetylase RimI-like enzyme
VTAGKPRVATAADVAAIVRIVNAAFVVESFFKAGERTDDREIAAMMQAGAFLLVEDDAGVPVASVYVGGEGSVGYIGMLAVEARAQGQGLGRTLTQAAESRCREAGCRAVEIRVVNLREELPKFYRRLGYAETGATLPFPPDEQTTRPCHFIVMRKPLA